MYSLGSFVNIVLYSLSLETKAKVKAGRSTNGQQSAQDEVLTEVGCEVANGSWCHEGVYVGLEIACSSKYCQGIGQARAAFGPGGQQCWTHGQKWIPSQGILDDETNLCQINAHMIWDKPNACIILSFIHSWQRTRIIIHSWINKRQTNYFKKEAAKLVCYLTLPFAGKLWNEMDGMPINCVVFFVALENKQPVRTICTHDNDHKVIIN